MTVSDAEFDRLVERVRQLELADAKRAGIQALFPWVTIVVTGLAGLGIWLRQ